MAYITGVANSLADLLTALRNGCTANGWTLSADVLHKGTCYVEVIHKPIIAGFTDKGFLQACAGTGIDGSNLLTGRATANHFGTGCLGPLGDGTSVTVTTDWDWPVTYHIHVLTAPDEVYMMVNYGSAQYWQMIAFGQSPAEGCPGTGNWHHGTSPQRAQATWNRLYGSSQVVCNPSGSSMSSFNGGVVPGAGPFWWFAKDESNSVALPAMFHGVYDHLGVVGWSNSRYTWQNAAANLINMVSASQAVQPLPVYSPNTWNNEAHLIRWQIMQPRLEFKSSVVGELQHIRFVRNDFLDDGQIIPLGPDSWKVYPMYRKDVTNRNGGGTAGASHSGTCAVAIRYDGV
jgi:hypothetical protein